MSKIVAVFFGGNSNEHEISVITGMLAANLLRGAEYDVLPVYLTRENALYTGEMHAVTDFKSISKKWKTLRFCEGGLETAKGHKKFPVDVVLNCCHGGAGEDGTLSALLKWYHIKNASPDLPVSAVFMDKTLTKIVAKGLGIPVLNGVSVKVGKTAELPFSYPVIVKPAKLGSSIGIKVANDEEEYQRALSLAFSLDDAALIEPYVREKRDLNCAAYRKNGKIVLSQIEEVFSHEEILSFREKYETGDEKRSKIPADIPEEIAENVRRYTEKLTEGFGVTGVVRADFLLVGDEVYFNELNTVPGSLACYLFGSSLTDSKNFLVSLVEEGLKSDISLKPTVTTGILNSSVFTAKGGKRAPRAF